MNSLDMSTASPASTPIEKITGLVRSVIEKLDHIPHCVLALCSRVFVASIFWMSGQTKVNGFHLSDSAVDLFRDEYNLPLIDPTVAAVLAAIGEHLFSALLIIGFASRFSAFALLGMTLVIEIFVYPDAWPTHGVWAASLLYVIARGPGKLSVDWLLFGRGQRG